MFATRLSDTVWAQINTLVSRHQSNDEVTRGTVIKVDTNNRNVFVKEFGDTAIPLVGFTYDIEYYDTDAAGAVQKKTYKAEPAMPKIGDLVVIARQSGQRRLPLCIGIVKGKNYIVGV